MKVVQFKVKFLIDFEGPTKLVTNKTQQNDRHNVSYGKCNGESFIISCASSHDISVVDDHVPESTAAKIISRLR